MPPWRARERKRVTNAVPDGLFLLDASGRIVWCNQAALVMHSLDAFRDIGKPIVLRARLDIAVAALDIAEASDLFIQPTKGVIDDMAPAVRMFHELVKHGIPKKKMVFALHGVLAAKEIEDGLDYLGGAGYEVFKGAMARNPMGRKGQIVSGQYC